MNFENIIISQQENDALITINRPTKLNALNKKTIEELHQALSLLEAAPKIKAIIIIGKGEKAFVAGADIAEFSDFSVEEGTELAASGQTLLFSFIEKMSTPVIAAINGYALGGGLELAMCCHIRVASPNAHMGLPETSLGVIPGYGGTQRLPQLIGKGRALEMILTAEMISAEKAHSWGLINHIVPQEELISYCKNLSNKITKNAPTAVAAAIASVNAGFTQTGYQKEVREFGACFGTEDFKEGTTAFLEKRKALFPGF